MENDGCASNRTSGCCWPLKPLAVPANPAKKPDPAAGLPMGLFGSRRTTGRGRVLPRRVGTHFGSPYKSDRGGVSQPGHSHGTGKRRSPDRFQGPTAWRWRAKSTRELVGAGLGRLARSEAGSDGGGWTRSISVVAASAEAGACNDKQTAGEQGGEPGGQHRNNQNPVGLEINQSLVSLECPQLTLPRAAGLIGNPDPFLQKGIAPSWASRSIEEMGWPDRPVPASPPWPSVSAWESALRAADPPLGSARSTSAGQRHPFGLQPAAAPPR